MSLQLSFKAVAGNSVGEWGFFFC